MKVQFKPLQDRVLVRRIEEDEKTTGGIILPDTAKEKPNKGEVVAVGPGRHDDAGKTIPMSVSTGDKILFTKWGGTEVNIGDEEYLVVKETDILGIIS